MVAQVKPTTKNSPAIKTGSNRNNKPASAYVDRAKEATADLAARANMSKADTVNMSVGNISKAAGNIGVKTSGIKMRGTGAATKGLMSRGPMA
jgi:hypothetical protein